MKGVWMVCNVFHVRVVSEVAPALSWRQEDEYARCYTVYRAHKHEPLSSTSQQDQELRLNKERVLR